jgi:hypothetical protein
MNLYETLKSFGICSIFEADTHRAHKIFSEDHHSCQDCLISLLKAQGMYSQRQKARGPGREVPLKLLASMRFRTIQ